MAVRGFTQIQAGRCLCSTACWALPLRFSFIEVEIDCMRTCVEMLLPEMVQGHFMNLSLLHNSDVIVPRCLMVLLFLTPTDAFFK